MCNPFNHHLNRLSIMRSRTARKLKPLFRTLVLAPSELRRHSPRPGHTLGDCLTHYLLHKCTCCVMHVIVIGVYECL